MAENDAMQYEVWGDREDEHGGALHSGPEQSRRGFLKTLGGAGALTAASASMGLGAGLLASPETAQAKGPGPSHNRQVRTFQVRKRAALIHLGEREPRQENNGDERRYADKRASFSKALPHDSLGEVDLSAYRALRDALGSGRPEDFDDVPLSSGAERRLANPQAAYAFDLMGRDSHATKVPPAPAFASDEIAAEMGEVYWQSIARDVPFLEYETDDLIAAAVDDLNAFSVILAPTEDGEITPRTIFRGGAPGDLIGPYLSQFLWLDVPYGASPIVQRYRVPVAGGEFMTGYGEWLAIQRGRAPAASVQFDPTPRYLYNGRGLGEYVHVDVLFQAYFNAALSLSRFGPDAFDLNNPYLGSANQAGFTTFGGAHFFDMVAKAARVALGGAWFHKWLVHRRLRPEMYGGRVENQIRGVKDYDIPSELLDSDALGRVLAGTGSALLPQAYPEGSPTHPAYPAGHSAVSGACATVLKAFANEDFVLPEPVQASTDGLALLPWAGADLSLGREINKLATNISIGRCTAGVHYRTDASGLEVGEAQAIGLLQDYSLTYNEDFDGFTLTRFDGERIRIVDGDVLPA
jgi:hypothetical protein